MDKLAEFALARHGWGDSNRGFGVTYPSDLDEYDKKVEGTDIPDGYVEIYGFWGPEKGGYEFKVKEQQYLLELIHLLKREGLTDKAETLESLLPNILKE